VRSTPVCLVLVLALLPGCGGCNSSSSGEGPAGPAPSAVASAAPSVVGAPSAAPSAATLAPSGKMAHCPNAVAGARTAVEDAPGGVVVTVTAKDPAALGDVRARVQALLDAQKNGGTSVKHTGNGEGGGLLGRCPIVLKDTTIAIAELADGEKLTIAAKDPSEVDWLRRETRDRQGDLEAAASPAGAGKMAHCPSAIAGTTTSLRNTKDGVSVTVVGSDDVTTKSIRERVKHLVDVAKSPEGGAGPAVASHTGEGGGGGSVGRCPVVLKDTMLAAKDVPGGSQVDLKAKTAGDVPKLQAEAKERAAKFQLPPTKASGKN
jgi:TusA-related sulfurtransferase